MSCAHADMGALRNTHQLSCIICVCFSLGCYNLGTALAATASQ